MKTLSQNIVPFVLRGLPRLNKLDQSTMRKLRKLADRTGWSVEDLIHEGILEFMAKREAEGELKSKIIRFRKPMGIGSKAKSRRCSDGPSSLKQWHSRTEAFQTGRSITDLPGNHR
jgi:hypothetical protein